MQKTKKKLGEMLMEAGLIDELQLRAALASQNEWGERLGSIIIKRGFVTEREVVAVIEKQLGLSCISLDSVEKPSAVLMQIVNVNTARKFGIFPLRFEGKTLLIATSDPTDLKALDDISFKIGVRIKPALAMESDIQKAISLHYEGCSGLGKTFVVDREKLTEGPVECVEAESNYELLREIPELERLPFRNASPISDLSPKTIVENLIDLLILKGIITREELVDHIKAKRQT